MKRSLVNLTILSCVLVLACSSIIRAQESDAETTIRDFYKQYITALVKNKKMTKAAMTPFLTTALLNKVVNTRDSDVVIQGQDYDATWAQNIAVTGDDANEGKETQYFFVSLKGADMSQRLAVTAKWDEDANTGGWKISAIKIATPEPESPTAEEKPGEQAVLEFYKMYLGALAKTDKRPSNAAMKPYLTTAMFNKIVNTRDADVVIQAQDFELAWAENIKVTPYRQGGEELLYYIVELKGVNMNQKLHVKAFWDDRVGGGWKIEDIKAAK